MLGVDLLVTIFTFLPPGLRAISVCACVSKDWRKAAYQSPVPRKLDMEHDCPGDGSWALEKLFERHFGHVRVVITHSSKDFDQKDSLFARVCHQASALQEVSM